MSDLLIGNVEVDGRLVDVEVRDGVITAITATADALPSSADRLDGGGGALLPGLHDHHIHLVAAAAAAESVDLSIPGVDLAEALRTTDRTRPAGSWVRAVGYHESIAGDIDRDALDRLVPDRPLRVQDRSGARWTLNSAACEAVDLDGGDHPGIERDPSGRPTGRLHRADEWLRDRLGPSAPPDLRPIGARLAALGVTGVTDTTPVSDPHGFDLLASAVATGVLPQRVTVTGGPSLAGMAPPPGLLAGPVKLVIDDADYGSLDDLVAGIDIAHEHRRPAAIHVVTRAALVLALAAFEAATQFPGDRIEHGAVIPPELFDPVRSLGLTVVTQPGFVATRGDQYLTDVDPDDLGDLYRCRTLLDAGIRVAGSTDAPYTDLDPWAAMRAAIERQTPSGVVLGSGERLGPQSALGLFLGRPDDPGGPTCELAIGEPADLVLLDRPLGSALADPTADAVAATVIHGNVVHHR